MPRIKQLDGLRAVAFLSVFIHHALRVPLLWIGVDAFFVLSGFLITGILLEMKERRGPFFGPFYIRRALRILPPYCIAIALSATLFSFDWGVSGTGTRSSRLTLAKAWDAAVEEFSSRSGPWPSRNSSILYGR